MVLTTYKKKRDFKKTPEPPAKVAKAGKQPSFVVQKHQASHLHYDFRLEMAGVLKSWAIPKGPSKNPSIRRLAVMVEDHPLAYGKFQGIIPEGEYGAGEVEIWDSGTYQALKHEKPELQSKELRQGTLEFSLQGKKLKGDWVLFKTNGKNWILKKMK